MDLELHEARKLAQNQLLWRLMSLYSTKALIMVHATIELYRTVNVTEMLSINFN